MIAAILMALAVGTLVLGMIHIYGFNVKGFWFPELDTINKKINKKLTTLYFISLGIIVPLLIYFYFCLSKTLEACIDPRLESQKKTIQFLFASIVIICLLHIPLSIAESSAVKFICQFMW